MPFLLVRHKVEDVSKWRRVFDSHTGAQSEAGLTIKHVFQNIDSPGATPDIYYLDEA